MRTLTVLMMAMLTITAAQAAVVDLQLNNSGTANGALFVWADQHSVGTGVIEPFVRIQANGQEQGYNTDGALQFDEKAGLWTHALLLTDVPQVDIGGTLYREFLLDINETKNQPDSLLSLDRIQLFMGNTGTPTNYASGPPPTLNGGSLIWDLDSAGDNWIKLDFARNPGSGWGDMFMYVPDALFVGGTNVTLYSRFGDQYQSDPGTDSNDGFEEWAVREPTPVIPEFGSLALALMGLVPVAVARARRRA